MEVKEYNALVHYGAKDFRYEKRPMFECGDNDVIVKNLVASVCSSDTDIWLNGGPKHYVFEGFEFGHEAVGEVYKVGKNVKGLKVGDRIAPNTMFFPAEMHRSGSIGGFSEYMYGTNIEVGKSLWILDDSISNTRAALIEPLAISAGHADKSGAQPHHKVVMLGAGFISIGIAARLAYKGMPKSNITFIDRIPLRLDYVRSQGFNAVDTSEENWLETLYGYTGTTYGANGLVSDADYYFDCAGANNPNSTEPTLLSRCFGWAKYGVTIDVVAVHRRTSHIPVENIVFSNFVLTSFAGQDWEASMELVKSDIIDLEAAVTHRVPHKDALELIKLTCDPNMTIKTQIDYTL